MQGSSINLLGPVHTYPDIFESATFSFRIQKFPSPHVAYSNRFARPHVSDGIWIHSSTQGSSALKCVQSMRRCSAILFIVRRVRDWIRLLRHRIKKYPDSPVHTFSDSLRIFFFHSGPSTRYRFRCGFFFFFHSGPESEFIFSGFAVEIAGYVWTVAESGKK